MKLQTLSLFDDEPPAPPHPVDAPDGSLKMMYKSEATVTYDPHTCRTCGGHIPGASPVLREYWDMTDGGRELRWRCMACYWRERSAAQC